MEEFNDIETRLEPEPHDDPGAGIPWGGITTLIGVALVVVFAVQNTESATIAFLWLSGDFPLSVVILVTAVASALLALTAGALSKRRRRKRRAERRELRDLRGGD